MITRPVSHATTRTLAAYLEGELDAHETRAIEAQLQASEDVRRQLDELREIRDALARPLPESADMDLTASVMKRIEALPPADLGANRRMAERTWPAFDFWPTVLASAACLALVYLGTNWKGDHVTDEYRSKAMQASRGPHDDAWTGLRIYSVDAAGQPRPLSGEMGPHDGLMFAYVNAGDHAFDYLMVFGIDQTRQLRWYHPAFEQAGTDPTSIRVEAATEPRLLPEVIEHELAPGRMTLYAVFSRVPMHVADLERAVAQGDDVIKHLATDSAVQTLSVLVSQ